MGSFLWFLAVIAWLASLVGYWIVADKADKVDAIFGMCIAIGLMLMGNRVNELDKK